MGFVERAGAAARPNGMPDCNGMCRGGALRPPRVEEAPIEQHRGGVGRTHGVSLHYDAVLQVQGRAGKRQVANHGLCIAESGPPPDAPGAQILSATPSP